MADIGSSTLNLSNTVIPVSYDIFQKDGLTYAKNGITGIIEKSNTDSSIVIQYTINQLTSGGKISIGDGTYTINITITVGNPNITIDGFGNGRTILIAKNSLNSDVIVITAPTVNLRNFKIDGNLNNQTNGRGIVVTSPTTLVMDSTFEDLDILSCKSHGLFLDTTVINLRLFRIRSQLNGGNGFDINGSDHYCNACEARTNTGFAWNLTGDSHSLVACAGSGSALSGYLAGSFRTDFIGCFSDTNFGHGMYLAGDLCSVIGGHYYLNNRNNTFYAGITVVGKKCRVSDVRIGGPPTSTNPQQHQYNIFVQSFASDTIVSNNTLVTEGASLGNFLDQGVRTIINKNLGYSSTREIVGLANPSVLFPDDTGKNWRDLGAVTTGAFTLSYLGNGIVIDGDFSGHIFRSTDYGNTWFDLGLISPNSFDQASSCYLGNGIAIVGDSVGHIWRSTDFGLTWTDLGQISTAPSPAIKQTVYLGSGITIFGDNAGHIFRSTDFGLTWADLGSIAPPIIISSCYLGNGIAIVGNSVGHIFRSTDSGLTWTDLGTISNSPMRNPCYLGNSIAVIMNNIGNVFRSTDSGLTWTDLGPISTDSGVSGSIVYVGNGIVIFGDAIGHMFRSTDYGFTWTNLGAISAGIIESMCYLSNGVIISGDSLGHIFRSDISYKIDESQVNYPKKPVNVTGSRSLGTVFTNSDMTRSLMVIIGVSITTTGAGQSGFARIKSDTGNPPTTVVSPKVGNEFSAAPEIYDLITFAIIPPSFNYLVETVLGVGVSSSLTSWFEAYI